MFAALAVLDNARVAGQPRDLWIGVVRYTDPYGQDFATRAVDSSTSIEPVGALVRGRWWHLATWDSRLEADLAQTIGKVPAQWLPIGTELPGQWQGRIFGRADVALRAGGPLFAARDDYELAVRTDYILPRADYGDGDGDAKGVAVAGDVRVNLFVELPTNEHGELTRFLAKNMLAAERAQLVNQGVDAYFDVKDLARQTASTPLRNVSVRAATQGGTRVYFLEGSKLLRTRDSVVSLVTGAAARRDRGALRALGAWSYLDTSDLGLGTTPLAVVERSGAACWLIGHIREGGVKYVLIRPGQIERNRFPFSCDIK